MHENAGDRLNVYLDGLGRQLRDKRQRASFAMYALGILSDGERKSMEPIAARACGAPERTQAFHERLVHFTSVLGGKCREHYARIQRGTLREDDAKLLFPHYEHILRQHRFLGEILRFDS